MNPLNLLYESFVENEIIAYVYTETINFLFSLKYARFGTFTSVFVLDRFN